MQSLVDYWYSIGNNQGPNIRALIIFGVFGTIYWYVIGWIVRKIITKLKTNSSYVHK